MDFLTTILTDEDFEHGILETLASRPALKDMPNRAAMFLALFVHLDVDGAGQGLTLAHFPAQPMPFWSVSRFVSSLSRVMTHPSTEGTKRIPQKVLTLSRNVDECKPLGGTIVRFNDKSD